jgi:hypothetical protein
MRSLSYLIWAVLMWAATLFVMNLPVLPMKQQATIAQTPNGMLVSQTILRLSEYAHWLPLTAAASIAGVTPATLVALLGTVRNVPTNSVADTTGSPALMAYSATSSGSLVVNLLTNTL